ncbi:MAG: hypothetical protein R3B60_01185 [Candidatus Paceibacterota bacterium]
MKQQILIISGAIVILILVAVWVYLLFFGTPKSVQDVLVKLGTVGEEEVNNTEENKEPTINTTGPNLRQLTTKSVAGFTEINNPDSGAANIPIIYYAEKGTGHVFSINLETGEENKISGTTVAETNHAEIDPNGDWIVFSKHTNTKNTNLTIGALDKETGETALEEPGLAVNSFTLSQDGQNLLYTTTDSNGLNGHNLNLTTKKDTIVFSLPFHEATIQWGNSAEDTHYVYPKPSYLLEGYLYKVKNNKIDRLPASGFGFSALANDKMIIYSTTNNRENNTSVFNLETLEKSELPITLLPEKCILGTNTTSLICAEDSLTTLPFNFPDEWYKGGMNFKDSLWLIDASELKTTLLADTFKQTSRELDIVDLYLGDSEYAVYFINKIDNTLWMYEL